MTRRVSEIRLNPRKVSKLEEVQKMGGLPPRLPHEEPPGPTPPRGWLGAEQEQSGAGSGWLGLGAGGGSGSGLGAGRVVRVRARLRDPRKIAGFPGSSTEIAQGSRGSRKTPEDHARVLARIARGFPATPRIARGRDTRAILAGSRKAPEDRVAHAILRVRARDLGAMGRCATPSEGSIPSGSIPVVHVAIAT